MEKRNLHCHKCKKHEWDCKCKDKKFRINSFEFNMHSACVRVALGSGYSSEDKSLFAFSFDSKKNKQYY